MSPKRTCSLCGEEKALEEFVKDNRLAGGRRGTCRKCRAAYIRQLRAEQGHRARHIWERYELTLEEVDLMRETHGDACAICGGDNGKRSLHIDHCHETGDIRGLLCVNCNHGLGCFGDDPDTFRAALAYLEVQG